MLEKRVRNIAQVHCTSCRPVQQVEFEWGADELVLTPIKYYSRLFQQQEAEILHRHATHHANLFFSKPPFNKPSFKKLKYSNYVRDKRQTCNTDTHCISYKDFLGVSLEEGKVASFILS